MGMAASQARLLCITARIHDVEYQAQSIQNAKIQLATQSDEAYREYNEALDATTLTMNAIDLNSGAKSTVPANFNNLCSRNKVTSADGSNNAILNNQGKLLVEESIINLLEKSNPNTIEDEEESRDENIEMMLSLRKIIDPQKIEFIDKVIECYKNGLFK